MDSVSPQKQATPIESQIYTLFAECLEVFRNKITLTIKINRDLMSSKTEQSKQLLNQVHSKCSQLYQIYLDLESHILEKHHQVYIRFVSRIKQMAHSFILKCQNKKLREQLMRIQQITKQIDKSQLKIREIMTYLLINTPQKYEGNIYQTQQCQIPNNLKNIYVDITTSQLANKQTINPKNNKLRESYERCLQKLSRDLNVLDCLCLDEQEYRRTFFLSLRNQTHQDYQLYQQISQRNKYIKWIMQLYLNSYNRYIVKKSSPKKKPNRRQAVSPVFKDKQQFNNTKLNKLLGEKVNENKLIKTQKNKLDKMRVKQIKQRNHNTNFYENIKNRNYYTQANEIVDESAEQGQKRVQLIGLEETFGEDFNRKNNCRNQEQKSKEFCQTFGGNLFPLKKIEIKDQKLALGPQRIIITSNVKKRDLFQRTQQKFRSKMSTSKSRQPSKKALQDTSYSFSNFITNKTPKNHLKTESSFKAETSVCPFYTPLNIVYSESSTKYYPSKINSKNPYRLIEQLNAQNIPKKVPDSQLQNQNKIFQITSVHSVEKYTQSSSKYKTVNNYKISKSKNQSKSNINNKFLNIGANRVQY